MNTLQKQRFSVYFIGTITALAIYTIAKSTVRPEALDFTLARGYGAAAFIALWISLMAAPLNRYARKLPGAIIRRYLSSTRRATGLLVFVFATLHARYTFFDILGGFPGIFAENTAYTVAIIASISAFGILAAMAVTASDAATKFLGPRTWKNLHRTVYLAGTLLLIHTLLISTHIDGRLSRAWGVAYFMGVSILITLQGRRVGDWLSKHQPNMTPTQAKLNSYLMGVVFFIIFSLAFFLTPYYTEL